MTKDTKIYYRISELTKGLEELYESGIQKGLDVGFNCMRDLYSVKLGCTTYLMGSPYSGKTELWFEILVNLSEFYGWKHAIFSPETGAKEDIAAELCHKFIRKPFYRNQVGAMTENERHHAQTWVNEHFFIIDIDDEVLTIEGFFSTVDELEVAYDTKVQTTTIDPFNEISHDFSANDGRQDLYIESVLGLVRRNARSNNRHNCIVTHCRDQAAVREGDITYFPAPTARDYAGGQAWFRKGLGMIAVWRPPFGLNDSLGDAYKENESHVIIQKSKPKGIGKRGTAKLYFDYGKSRFYESGPTGENKYAAKYEAQPMKSLKPNLDFNPNNRIEPLKETENPF